MDELTLLRNTRDDSIPVPDATLEAGLDALIARAAMADARAERPPARSVRRRVLPRLGWAAAGVAAIAAAVLVVGNLGGVGDEMHADQGTGIVVGPAPAGAVEILRAAAEETRGHADLVPGSGQYLRAQTRARWMVCYDPTPNRMPPDADRDPSLPVPPPVPVEDDDAQVCAPGAIEDIDVYMPADPTAEWVLLRSGAAGGGRAVNGEFYGQGSRWVPADIAAIPLDGQAAYAWVDAQYGGGSASREEADFKAIAEILRTGLVPAGPRAALLDALSLIPGVTASAGVANLDGVIGVAIGRDEPARDGQREEIIIDPATGLVIGERTLAGTEHYGMDPDVPFALTAITTTVVDTAP